MFKNWISVLTKPGETFRQEKENANINEAIKGIVAAGIIAGILFFIDMNISLCFDEPNIIIGTYPGFFESIIMSMATMIYLPLYGIINLAILSGILHVSAKFFGGNGTLTTQTYLISLFFAPIFVIYFFTALFVSPVVIIFIPYFLYLLTLALKETHNYGTKNSVLTWIAPIGCIGIFVSILLLFSSIFQ